MNERMIARFTAPRRLVYVPDLIWYTKRAWATVKRFAALIDWGYVIGEFFAAVGFFMIWLLLPLFAG